LRNQALRKQRHEDGDKNGTHTANVPPVILRREECIGDNAFVENSAGYESRGADWKP
jgi:hypothetical protein